MAGSTAAAGSTGLAGTSGGGGRSGASGGSGGAGASAAGSGGGAAATEEKFSFFVTSLEGMQRLAKSDKGFGGNLTYGQADGLSGADKICTELAEHSLPGSGAKGWHAFLSVAQGPGGGPVHAIERIGSGPWYDRTGRLVAMNIAALQNPRPMGAHNAIKEDLPNEYGVPNSHPDPTMPNMRVDNHHVLTGSDGMGKLYQSKVDGTCVNWTSTATEAKRPRIGFSWSVDNRVHWISGQDEGGCGAGVNIVEMGGSDPSNPIVGSGGGYGAIYCFALKP